MRKKKLTNSLAEDIVLHIFIDHTLKNVRHFFHFRLLDDVFYFLNTTVYMTDSENIRTNYSEACNTSSIYKYIFYKKKFALCNIYYYIAC